MWVGPDSIRDTLIRIFEKFENDPPEVEQACDFILAVEPEDDFLDLD